MASKFLPPFLLASLSLTAAAWLSACGGGTSTASNGSGIGSGGTGSYTTGSVSGFGSVIVNGVRYDDTGVSPVSLDGDSAPTLAIGMVVEIEGSGTATQTDGSLTAQATAIRVGHELLGPIDVSSVNTTLGTFRVLGQQVSTSVDTFYDQSNKLAGLGQPDCAYVKVYGFLRPLGYAATRVECIGDASAPSRYRVRGRVSSASNVTVGLTGVSYNLQAGVVAPAIGQIVRAELAPSGSSWTITRLTPESRDFSLRQEGRVEGVMGEYNSSTGTFQVNGAAVRVTSTTRKEPADLVLADNLRVEVEGRVVNGVIVADTIEEEDEDYRSGSGSDDDPVEGVQRIDLRGLIANVATDRSAITVRGVRVLVGPTVDYRNGDASALILNASVRVKGVRAADGVNVRAVEIEFDGR